jgi:hypothetical protein
VMGRTSGRRCTGSTPPAYRLALEKGKTGSRFHGVADRGIPTKEIAEVIGRRLSVPAVSRSPEEAAALLGFIGHMLGMGAHSSSAQTQEILGWRPTQRASSPTSRRAATSTRDSGAGLARERARRSTHEGGARPGQAASHRRACPRD